MIRFYIMIAIMGLVGSVGYGAYSYVTKMQDRITTLSANNARLETAVETQTATIDNLRADAARFQELNRELQASLDAAEEGLNNLRQTLTDHNLTRLSIERPGLIERRINDATTEVFNSIESDTSN